MLLALGAFGGGGLPPSPLSILDAVSLDDSRRPGLEALAQPMLRIRRAIEAPAAAETERRMMNDDDNEDGWRRRFDVLVLIAMMN